MYFEPENQKGDCAHKGEWHNRYAMCSARCVAGLAMNGLKGPLNKFTLAHWSCCYTVQLDAPCPNSEPHFSSYSDCVRCGGKFIAEENGGGGCRHGGTWHASRGDCSLGCALKLGPRRLGLQHWSCCYSTEKDDMCTQSAPHVMR